MASAGRKLGWAGLGLFTIYTLAAACSGDDTVHAENCEALDTLGAETEPSRSFWFGRV